MRLSLKQFSAEIENSANPLVPLAFPAFDKCRKKEFSILATLAMVRAAVEYKLHGEQAFQAVTDPCSNGPFTFERFTFEGIDRGFQLKSAYAGRGFQESLIFAEKKERPSRSSDRMSASLCRNQNNRRDDNPAGQSRWTARLFRR